ncbi:hypothetical protein AAA450_07555 [Staphylococcus equorum]|uniref:hypothetical protein n=1 Tax=Staphylococcus equorum TaxID=246432 RepID=UPI003D805948
MKLTDYFECESIKREGYFENLGHCISTCNNMLTFIDDENYIDDINNNTKVTSVICTKSIFLKLKRKNIGVVISEKPRYDFFDLHNNLGSFQQKENIISPSANIAKSSIISGNNIKIGKNVVVEDFVVIKSNTTIGHNSVIGQGCIIGNDGYEYKRNGNEILKVNHYGRVNIGENVELKEYVTIHKSVFTWDETKIDDNCKVDAHTHIAHGSKIGRNVLIGSHSNIAGNVFIDNHSYIGPSVTVSNRIEVLENSKLTIGSVVTKNTSKNQQVTGNFAIDHKSFLNNLKKIRGDYNE